MTFDRSLESLEHAISHRFVRRELLALALTHRSHSSPHNERLEFLGDSILNCAIAALLYRNFPQLKEGDLSRLRASLVKQDALAEVAQTLHLGNYLHLGDGEIKSGGNRRPSTLADALEAVLGAVYIDAGFNAAANVIETLYQPLLQQVDPDIAGRDPKTELQELLQARRLDLPRYELRSTQGEAHAQKFNIECVIVSLGISCKGSGTSRRAAEQDAARQALTMAKAT